MSNNAIQAHVIEPQNNVVPIRNPYMAMAQIALESGKVDQLDKLLDLQLRWDAEQARKAYVRAMADFKSEPIEIAKSKHVSFKTNTGKTEYDHAELHDITRILVPKMARHGLSHRWTLSQSNGITVECIVTHRDGHSETVAMTAPSDTSGGKNAIQAIASTKTYLERYTLLAATGVATGGEIDNDGRTYESADDIETITEAQAAELRDIATEANADMAKFLALGNLEKLEDMPVAAFANARKVLNQKLAATQKLQAGKA